MKKSEDLLVKFLIALAGLTIGVVVVLTIIAFQIGVDELEKPNRIAIISGLLSMGGGIAGAFGAYFIARMQMTKQLDLQYRKEHEKMLLEIKINKYQELIFIYEQLYHSLYVLRLMFIEVLLEMVITISSDKQKELRGKIMSEIKDIRVNSTKINAYKGFFDENELAELPNVFLSIHTLEIEIFRLLREAQESVIATPEEFERISERLNEKSNAIIDIPDLQIVRTLEFIQNKFIKLVSNNNI